MLKRADDDNNGLGSVVVPATIGAGLGAAGYHVYKQSQPPTIKEVTKVKTLAPKWKNLSKKERKKVYKELKTKDLPKKTRAKLYDRFTRVQEKQMMKNLKAQEAAKATAKGLGKIENFAKGMASYLPFKAAELNKLAVCAVAKKVKARKCGKVC